jgi:hypothetical protein
MRVTARRLAQRHSPVRLQAVLGTDADAFLPADGHEDKAQHRRPKIGLNEGFDLIWLDWMSRLNDGPRHSLSNLCRGIDIFERAWNQGLPGLLYITLTAGQEQGLNMETLDLWLDRQPQDSRPGLDLNEIRSWGLASIFECLIRPMGANCRPIRLIQYQDAHKRQRMLLAGFEIYKGSETTALNQPLIERPSTIEQ